MNGKWALGLIGCLVLGDEMVHVLESDTSVRDVLIVDSPEGRVLRDKMDPAATGQRVSLVAEEDLGSVEISGPSAIVIVKGASLHDDPETLLDGLASSVRTVEHLCSSILLFYGQCRNTKYKLRRFVESFSVPVMFLTDANGEVVDDCFAAVLGGRSRYVEMIKGNKRTMLLTVGYAEYWSKKQESKGLESIMQQYENLDLLFKTFGYDKVMMLDNGLGDREEFKERTRIFAAMFGLSVETTLCGMTVFERSYRMAWAMAPLSRTVPGSMPEIVLSRTLP